MGTVQIKPLTRVEGHLDVEVVVEEVQGTQQVVDAASSGTMFRGFEIMLQGRDPLDATHYTQRVCGVCPIAHGMASSLCLEDAFGLVPPANGRIVRNLVLGANFLQSHILHFYHLSALDYVDTTGLLDMSPWTPRPGASDMVGGATAQAFVSHYVEALSLRRKAHQMGAVLGGKMPCSPVFVPGGATERVQAEHIQNFRSLLNELREFIANVYVPDAQAVADAFPQYADIGVGCGNLLAYGAFDLTDGGSAKLLPRGRYTDGSLAGVDVGQIIEYVSHSYYTSEKGNRNPAVGITVPQPEKAGAYSWVTAPRYLGKVHEVGPLARMWATGDYRAGISVVDRMLARALEAHKIALAMDGWLSELEVGGSSYAYKDTPDQASGIGLTEAPRGALGHWIDIAGGRIDRFQIVTPTNWNASPKDDAGQHGPIEQALIGTPVADADDPVEVLRVVHSFDPCLSCSVHMLRPGGDARRFVVAV